MGDTTGSGNVFGQARFHVVGRRPKTTPDPPRGPFNPTIFLSSNFSVIIAPARFSLPLVTENVNVTPASTLVRYHQSS